MKLDNATRAQYKRALLQAGQTTAGLTDADLKLAFYALSGDTIHTKIEEKEPVVVVEEKPVKVKKPVKKAPVIEPPTASTQSIELPNGSTININMVAGATLNITIKAA